MAECFMLHRAKARIPKFTYTGSYEVIDDGHGNWRIKFLTSGTLTFTSLANASRGIDVFLVGAGAGGVSYVGTIVSVAGGGAGYTKTQKNVPVTRGTSYSIVIGSGGANKSYQAGNPSSVTGNAGGSTSAFGYTASGGGSCKAGHNYYPETYNYSWSDGGNGGSGGGPHNKNGGTNGGNGENGGTHHAGGTGQGTTTREFGENDGALYATGGGSSSARGGANTGNGNYGGSSGSGGSGIVVIRNHR